MVCLRLVCGCVGEAKKNEEKREKWNRGETNEGWGVQQGIPTTLLRTASKEELFFSFSFLFGRVRKLGHATKKKKKKSVEGSDSDHHEERKTKREKKKKRDASRAEDVNELVLCHKLLVTPSLLN